MKISELKQQAGIQDNPDQEGLDLFAQLVIDECCKAVGDGHSWRSITVEEIRRHFGLR
jgi:hypothetical protein